MRWPKLTLVVVLFSDASRIDFRHLSRDFRIPRQMLLFGLPGAVIAGTLVGIVLLPEIGFWTAAYWQQFWHRLMRHWRSGGQ